MERLIYREEQLVRQSVMPWIVIPAWLFMIGTFGYGFYQQFYLGRAFGDEPMSNNGLLLTGILTITLTGIFFVVLLSGSLDTEIWSDGIRYKFPPFIRNLKHIPLSDIASAEVSKYRPLVEFGGWGWRKRLFSRKTAYNLGGNIGLRVVRKNGSQIVFGTRKKDEMKRAVDKMMLTGTEQRF